MYQGGIVLEELGPKGVEKRKRPAVEIFVI